MSEKSIIIIGAGLAGLSAGCYGRMNGYRTRILEHHSEPGGVATAWEHGDYHIDGGIHYLMGHKPGPACYEIYRAAWHAAKPPLSRPHHVRALHGRGHRQTGQLHRTTWTGWPRDLKNVAPEDAGFIDEFIAGARAMRRADLFALMETPPELMGLFGPIKQLWGMRRVLRYFGGKFNLPVEEYARAVKNDDLRRMLANFFLPEVPVWFVLLMLALLADKQLGLLEGGCTDFVASLAERYKGLGGEINYNATVKEIIVENDRAVGVRLADGTEHRADVVVSAGDGHSTILQVAGRTLREPQDHRALRKLETAAARRHVQFRRARGRFRTNRR